MASALLTTWAHSLLLLQAESSVILHALKRTPTIVSICPQPLWHNEEFEGLHIVNIRY